MIHSFIWLYFIILITQARILSRAFPGVGAFGLGVLEAGRGRFHDLRLAKKKGLQAVGHLIRCKQAGRRRSRFWLLRYTGEHHERP